MAYVKINDDHLESYADSIRYAKNGTEYTTTLERARAEIAEDNGYFNDISEAVQSKTGQVEPYDKSELAGAIDGIVVDPNANLDAYIQGDLTNVTTNAKTIASNVFRNNLFITSITMTQVETIGAYAFAASSLKTIVLPQTLVSLSNGSFLNCSNLKIEVIPDLVTLIPVSCFSGCTNITNLIFPSNLSGISAGGFANCSGILSIDLSRVINMPTIATNSFANTTCTFLFRDQPQLDAYAAATNWSALADRFQIKGGAS